MKSTAIHSYHCVCAVLSLDYSQCLFTVQSHIGYDIMVDLSCNANSHKTRFMYLVGKWKRRLSWLVLHSWRALKKERRQNWHLMGCCFPCKRSLVGCNFLYFTCITKKQDWKWGWKNKTKQNTMVEIRWVLFSLCNWHGTHFMGKSWGKKKTTFFKHHI